MGKFVLGQVNEHTLLVAMQFRVIMFAMLDGQMNNFLLGWRIEVHLTYLFPAHFILTNAEFSPKIKNHLATRLLPSSWG